MTIPGVGFDLHGGGHGWGCAGGAAGGWHWGGRAGTHPPCQVRDPQEPQAVTGDWDADGSQRALLVGGIGCRAGLVGHRPDLGSGDMTLSLTQVTLHQQHVD